MPAVDPSSRARRSGFVPLCAVLLAALGILWMLPGCLNPLPDDQPSYRNVPAPPPAAGPSAPSPGEDGEPGAGAGMSPESPNVDGEGSPSSNPDDLTPDAELQPDAGAPEAGVAAESDPAAGAIQ